MLAGDQQEQIRQQLEHAYSESGSAETFAAFIRHEADGRLHCEVKIYFSPITSEIAASLNARRCGQPSPIGLSLLSGSETALHALFSGDQQ